MIRSARLVAVVTAALFALACSESTRIAPPPSAPRLDQPALAIPADLDLVVRLDLKRLRAVLGLDSSVVLDELARRVPSDAPDRDTAELLRRLFARADTLWIAARPGLSPELTDSVVVLRGDFRDQVPRTLGGTPPFNQPEDLGGDVRRFERATPALRSAPAVLYVRGSDVVVVGSAAEIDSLSRTVEEGKDDGAVRAPETGLVAFAARLTDLVRHIAERSPTVARMLEGAARIEGSVDHGASGFRFRVGIHFDEGGRARRGADALRALLAAFSASGRAWLDHVKVDAAGSDLTLGLDLADAELSRALACWQRAEC